VDAVTDETTAAADPLKTLVKRLLGVWRDACDVDGGDLQQWLHEAGVLAEVTMPEPCGEACACADGGADFPTTCYRIAEEYR
jgi:hypothetical protein